MFDPQAKGLDIVQRSVLGSMLPEAMVCYLENYEAERFSEIFLGEFDTPEAIWSSEMRSDLVPRSGLPVSEPFLCTSSRTKAQTQKKSKQENQSWHSTAPEVMNIVKYCSAFGAVVCQL